MRIDRVGNGELEGLFSIKQENIVSFIMSCINGVEKTAKTIDDTSLRLFWMLIYALNVI